MSRFFKSIASSIVPAALGYATGGTGGAAIAGLGSLFGGGGGGSGHYPNPADNARPYLDQVAPELRNAYSPFITPGRENENIGSSAISEIINMYKNEFPSEYSDMASNPTDFLNKIYSSYKPSTGYQYKENKLTSAARNSAASGGFAGNRYDQGNQAELVNGILGEDMQQYLANILGIQGSGLSGRERQLEGRAKGLGLRADTGYRAANDLATGLSNNYLGQAGLAFQGQNQLNANNLQRRKDRNDQFSQLLALGSGDAGKKASTVIGDIFGGGGKSTTPPIIPSGNSLQWPTANGRWF